MATENRMAGLTRLMLLTCLAISSAPSVDFDVVMTEWFTENVIHHESWEGHAPYLTSLVDIGGAEIMCLTGELWREIASVDQYEFSIRQMRLDPRVLYFGFIYPAGDDEISLTDVLVRYAVFNGGTAFVDFVDPDFSVRVQVGVSDGSETSEYRVVLWGSAFTLDNLRSVLTPTDYQTPAHPERR